MESLLEQFFEFLFAVAIGLVAGYIYDLYCLVRRKYRLRGVMSGFGDIAFWVILSVMVFLALLLGNKGEVRFYILFGIILGVLFYKRFFSSTAVTITLKICGLIGAVFFQVMRPFRFLGRLVFRNRFANKVRAKLKTLKTSLGKRFS